VRATRVRRLRARRAKEITCIVVLTIGGSLAFAQAQAKDVHDVGVWVVERASAQSFGKAADALDEANPSGVAVGSSIVSVEAVVSGKVHDVHTNASTVGALLSAMGIRADADDRVAPPPSTPLHPGTVVTFDRVRSAVRAVTVAIPAPVDVEYTTSLGLGEVRVIQPGSDGLRLVTERIEIVNGAVVGRETISSVQLRAPVPGRALAGPEPPGAGLTQAPFTGLRRQSGQATWYDPPWSGLTAAHPFLPMGTYVSVVDVATGRSVTVVIDDRGPFAQGRIIDLSPEAFSALAPLGRGVLRVRIDW
jgi:Lytic transglycolase/G5 domain/G5-linked-Ubiquitin-like domain